MNFRRKPFDQQRSKTEPKLDFFFELELLPWERSKLIDLLAYEKNPTITERNHLLQKLRFARRQKGQPLPDGRIDWDEAERLARKRGGSVVDLVWDEARRKDPLPPAA